MDDLISRQDAIDAMDDFILDEITNMLGDSVREILEGLPSAEPQIIRCKDCKHRDEIECPMRYEEWVEYEEDGYFEIDEVIHDRTLDDGFCDRGERGEQGDSV